MNFLMNAFLKLYIVLIWVVLISFTGFELTCMLPVLKVSFHSFEQRYFKECLPYVIVWNLGMYNSLFTILLRFWVSVRTSLLSWKRFIKSVGKVVQWKSYTSLNWKNFITSLTFKKFKSQNFWFETWVSGGEKVKMRMHFLCRTSIALMFSSYERPQTLQPYIKLE